MTDHQFSILWGEASTSPDRAVFVSRRYHIRKRRGFGTISRAF